MQNLDILDSYEWREALIFGFSCIETTFPERNTDILNIQAKIKNITNLFAFSERVTSSKQKI